MDDPFYKQGWVCPKCGAVMNPDLPSCINCKGIQSNQFTYGSEQFINTNINQSISKGDE